MPSLLDLVESMLAGEPVRTEAVEALHQMLARGELVATAPGARIQEELLEKEELDQDVGLNLLQLLGDTMAMPGSPGGTTPSYARFDTLASSELDSPMVTRPLLARRSLGHALGQLARGQSDLRSCTDDAAADGASAAAPGGGGTWKSAVFARLESRGGLGFEGGVQRSGGSHSSLLPCGLGGLRSSHSPAASIILQPADDDDTDEPSAPFSTLFLAMDVVLATVDTWRFDAFRLADATAGHPASALGFWLIKRAGLVEALQLDVQALARFLRRIENGYPDNPYHNRTHASDVLQVCDTRPW